MLASFVVLCCGVYTGTGSDRGLAVGVMLAGNVMGHALPNLVNGVGTVDWTIVVTATSVMSTVGGLGVWLFVKTGPNPFPSAKFDIKQVGVVWTNRAVRWASMGYFGHQWELYGMWGYLPSLLTQVLIDRGTSSERAFSQASLLAWIVIGVCGGIGCIAVGWYSDRYGRVNALIGVMIASGACALMIGTLTYAAPTALIVVIAMVWGASVVSDSPQFSTIVTEVADPAYVGTAVTMQLAVGYVFTIGGVFAIPALLSELSWSWVFAVLTPGPLLGALAIHQLRACTDDLPRIAGGRG